MKKCLLIFVVMFICAFNSCGQSIADDIKKGGLARLDGLLAEDDLRSASKDDLRILRNTIFAKYGYQFQDEGLREHFQRFSWYAGTKTNVDSDLTDTDKANIRLIQSFEEKLKEPQTTEAAGPFAPPDGLHYIKVDKYSSANTVSVAAMSDFEKLIHDNKTINILYTDQIFIADINSILYTIPSKGYAAISEYKDGDAIQFKDGASYYYAKRTGLNNQEEADYYRQEQFLSARDYRNAKDAGFVKSAAAEKLRDLTGILTKADLEKSFHYAAALIYLMRLNAKTSLPNEQPLSAVDIDELIRLSSGTIIPFGAGYYSVRIGPSYGHRNRPDSVAGEDAWFYYAAKLAQYSDAEDFFRTVQTNEQKPAYTIKNTGIRLVELGFLSYPDFYQAVGWGYASSGDYYLAGNYGLGGQKNIFENNRPLISELEKIKKDFTIENNGYAFCVYNILSRPSGIPVSVDVFMREFQDAYSRTDLFRNGRQYSIRFNSNQFDKIYTETPKMQNVIVYDAAGKSFYRK